MVALASSGALVQAASPVLESITFEKEAAGEKIYLQLSSEVNPTIFEIPGEKPRIVLDFPDTVYPLGKRTTIPAEGELISQIRVGRHAKPVAKTRVVMDMAVGVNYSFVKEYNVSSKSLRVLISQPDHNQQDRQDSVKFPPKGMVDPEDSAEQKRPVDQQPERRNEAGQALVHPSETDQLHLETIEERGSHQSQVAQSAPEVINDNDALEPEKEQKAEIILHEVRYEKSNSGKEMIFFRLNGFYPPTVFSSQGSDLYVVCDFLGAVPAAELTGSIASGDDHIQSITITAAEEPARVRVLIELFETLDYDLKQVFFREDNLFVLMLSNLGERKNQ